MYTIKQAAARTGISVPLLRAWERRYGVVRPARTPSGYRIYDDGAIDRLRAMRRLVMSGWAPSAAASAVLDGTAPASGVSTLEGIAQVEVAPDLIGPFIEAAAELDALAIEGALDDMFANGSFERIAVSYLLPSLEALGEAWASGRIDVGAEHMASHAVLRRLTAAFEAAGTSAERDGVVLVGLPPGARHELGALAFAVGARRAGLHILYLGSDLPAESWVATAVRSRARAAVIGAVMLPDRQSAEAVAGALREARQDLLIAFGGRFQPPERSDEFVIHLPIDLTESIGILIGALDSLPLRRPSGRPGRRRAGPNPGSTAV